MEDSLEEQQFKASYYDAIAKDAVINKDEDTGFMAQLKADKILQDFEDTLDNVKRTEDGIIQLGQPLAGKNLKSALMTVARAYVNPNKLLSNYTGDEINERCKEVSDAIATALEAFYMEIKIEHINIIQLAAENMIEDAYRRAKDGLERETGRKQSHEIVNVQNKPQQSGIGASVKRFLE